MKVTKKVAPVARKTRVVKPSLTIVADRSEAKSGRKITLNVDFKGAEKVVLELEPHGTFDMDLTSLKKPGLVRLHARKDGKATVIATALGKGGKGVQRLVHLQCHGPVVKIIGFGYIPAKE